MNVEIIEFTETKVAAVEHRGAPEREYESASKLIVWRKANRVPPDRHQTYGVHYDDPRTTPPDQYRVDFCVSWDADVPPNPQGVLSKVLPGGRCARVRHHGSRENVTAALWLCEVWLPHSGEARRDFPLFFHYVNVGPDVTDAEMITDVYLPLL